MPRPHSEPGRQGVASRRVENTRRAEVNGADAAGDGDVANSYAGLRAHQVNQSAFEEGPFNMDSRRTRPRRRSGCLPSDPSIPVNLAGTDAPRCDPELCQERKRRGWNSLDTCRVNVVSPSFGKGMTLN